MENSSNEIKVFGTPTETTAEAPTNITPNADTQTQTIVFEENPTEVNPQETEEVKQVEATNQTKEIEVESTKEVKQPKAEEKEKPFEISFGSSKTKNESTDAPKETKEISESQVLEFLKLKGIEVDDFSKLSKKESLSEDVEKFKKYKEEIGGSLKDYFESQRDWSKETKTDTIREFYKSKYPTLSEEDLDTQLDLLSITEEDQDDLTERELKQKTLDYNKTYTEALSFMQNKAKEYNIPENAKRQYQEPSVEDIAKAHRPYWESRDKSLDNLNDVKISLGDVGDITLSLTQENKDLLSRHTQTQDAYFARWQKDPSKLKAGEATIDTDSALKDTMWAIPEIREQLIASMLEQSHALFIEKFSKENRNVNLSGNGTQTKIEEQKQGVTIFGNTEKSKAGTPLF